MFLLFMVTLLECCYIEIENSQLGSLLHPFNRKILFSTDTHCLYLDLSPEMRQTQLYLLYPLSQVRWERRLTD